MNAAEIQIRAGERDCLWFNHGHLVEMMKAAKIEVR
jgi:hypothetical protein